MPEHIHTYSTRVTDAWGIRYRVHVEGEPNRLGTWDGYLVFEPEGGGGPPLRTGRETTQPKQSDLVYWASGLEPVYLDGALARARIG